MSLQSGRAPGIDGLPADLLKYFWSIIGQDLLEVINNSLQNGRLPLSCRRAVITLLPKKGDLQDLKNWRPVYLLCTDTKSCLKLWSSGNGVRPPPWPDLLCALQANKGQCHVDSRCFGPPQFIGSRDWSFHTPGKGFWPSWTPVFMAAWVLLLTSREVWGRAALSLVCCTLWTSSLCSIS